MKKYVKQIIITLCVFFFCLTDQRIGSRGGEGHFIYPVCSGIALGIIILSHYKIKDFIKIPYLIWTIFAIPIVFLLYNWGLENQQYPHYFLSILLLLMQFGYIIIRTLYAIFQEKKYPNWNIPMLILFFVMMLLISFSRFDYHWPKVHFLIFGTFYLTNFTKKEQRNLLLAIQDGIILSFVVLQIIAYIYRPYDTIRYNGMYANTNMNALFYQSVYCAFLSKFCMLERKKTRPAITFLKWASFFFACSMWSFVLLTMCRSAMLGMAAATLLAFLYCLRFQEKNKLLQGGKYILITGIFCVIGFPLVYSSVRYLPALQPRPIWFYNEYTPDKIHPGDPIDSPKYTHWRDVIEGNLGRLPSLGEIRSHHESVPIYLASTKITASLLSTPEEKDTSSVSYRKKIYTYYLHSLNLRGHLESENGVGITETYFAPHAHNLFLQYAFNFGIPAGILFVIFMVASNLVLIVRAFRHPSTGMEPTSLLLFTACMVFGLTEVMWRNGQLSSMLLFILPYFAWNTAPISDVQKSDIT